MYRNLECSFQKVKKGADSIEKVNALNIVCDLEEGKGTFRFHKLSREIIGRLDVRPISIFI